MPLKLEFMLDAEQVQKLSSVLAIIVGALLFWMWVSYISRRAQRHFRTLLALAAQSRDPQSEMASAQRRLTALGIIVNAAKYFGAFSVAISLLLQLNVRLDSLLLPAGFLGAALGLGAQNFVRDIVAGFFFVFEGQFSVGDIVTINGTQGTVEEVGLRVTRLRDDSGQIFFFPNGAITTVAKFPRRAVPLQIWLPLSPEAEAARVSDVVAAVLQSFDAQWDWQLTDLSSVKFASPLPPNEPSLSKLPSTSEEALPPADIAPGEVAVVASKPMLWQRRRIAAPPARVVLLREKLPSYLASALGGSGLPTANGASIEVMPAPFEDDQLKT